MPTLSRNITIRFRDGAATSFEAVVDRYTPSLTAFAAGFVSDGEEVKDIVQDVFVGLWSRREAFTDGEHLRRWLYLSARNRCVNTLSSARYRRRSPTQGEDDAAGPDPTLAIMRQEVTRILLETIADLPPRTAEVLRLTLDGYSLDEIAARMGIALSSVKTMKRGGIDKVREKWGAK
jgi:RNA polymerase sigma-70 factor (ECF subfamily)